MMLRAQETGEFKPLTNRLARYPSGDTALSLEVPHDMYRLRNSPAETYISKKTTESNLQLLGFFVSFNARSIDSPNPEMFRI